MKKVLFVITKSNWGGAQRYVFDLATSLPKEEFEAVVAFGGTGAKDAPEGLLATKLKTAGIRTIYIESFMRDVSFSKEFLAYTELKKIFKDEKPDTVHLNSSKAGGLGTLAARRTGIKNIIFTSHGLAFDEDRNLIARRAIWLATWITFLLCNKVIVLTSDMQKRAQRMPGCGKKIYLVHNGIAPLVFLSREDARQALNLPRDATVIGTLGELTWNKNYHALVRAAGILKHINKQFLICIMGEGEEHSFIEELIAEEDVAGQTILKGFVQDGAQYLKAYDIFVFPSLKEGLPYVLMEAGQAALPTAASDIPGNKEIIEDNVSGLLAPPKNEHALASQLSKLLDVAELRDRLGAALQDKVNKEFSLEKMMNETLALY